MTAQEILGELHRRGVKLTVRDGRIIACPIEAVPPELRAAAQQVRGELIQLLSEPAPEAPTEPVTLDGIEPSVRAKIQEIAAAALSLGWPNWRLWEHRFWPGPRGLAALMDPSDQIRELTPEWIQIEKRDGSRQRFFRFDG